MVKKKENQQSISVFEGMKFVLQWILLGNIGTDSLSPTSHKKTWILKLEYGIK